MPDTLTQMQMLARSTILELLGAAVIAASSIPTVTFAQASVPSEAAEYAVPHERVAVGQGRRLNLYCRGTGSPTVVFESGMGDAAWAWLYVQPAVSKVTRACVYDRAGFGFSDSSTRPGTAANAVDDLHSLLKGAKIASPVILVGHSYGGLIAQLYAYTYPQDIGGLVLVDSYHEDAQARGNKITDGALSRVAAQMTAAFEECRAAATAGMREGTDAWEQCVGDDSATYGPVLWSAVKASRQSSRGFDAIASERDNENGETAAELRAARKPFGDLPLVYLTRGVSPFAVPGKPQSAINKAYEDDVLKSHDEIVGLTSRGVNYVVPGAGHDIQVDKPQAVIDAVLAVIGMQGR